MTNDDDRELTREETLRLGQHLYPESRWCERCSDTMRDPETQGPCFNCCGDLVAKPDSESDAKN